MNRSNRPDRATVERIVREEARRHETTAAPVLAMKLYRRSKLARRAAMLRILAETGCSRSGLAAVWGCDRQVVCRLVHRQPEPEQTETGNVGSRLPPAWACDPDLAAWNRLGRHGEAA